MTRRATRLRLLRWVWECLELLHDWDLRGGARYRRECFARRRILAVTLALLIIDRPRVGAYSCSLKVLDGASHVNPPPPQIMALIIPGLTAHPFLQHCRDMGDVTRNYGRISIIRRVA